MRAQCLADMEHNTHRYQWVVLNKLMCTHHSWGLGLWAHATITVMLNFAPHNSISVRINSCKSCSARRCKIQPCDWSLFNLLLMFQSLLKHLTREVQFPSLLSVCFSFAGIWINQSWNPIGSLQKSLAAPSKQDNQRVSLQISEINRLTNQPQNNALLVLFDVQCFFECRKQIMVGASVWFDGELGSSRVKKRCMQVSDSLQETTHGQYAPESNIAMFKRTWVGCFILILPSRTPCFAGFPGLAPQRQYDETWQITDIIKRCVHAVSGSVALRKTQLTVRLVTRHRFFNRLTQSHTRCCRDVSLHTSETQSIFQAILAAAALRKGSSHLYGNCIDLWLGK